MRVLILANNSDGLHGFRKELIAAIAENHTVIASTPDNGFFPELEALGCRMIETPLDRRGINPVKDFGLLLRYRKIVRAEKPGLVITYTIKPNVYGGLVCRLLRVPYAVNITGLGTAFQNPGMLRRLVTMLYKTGLKKAKTVFFENAGNMQIMRDMGIVTDAQCCLLNGAGVNLAHYTPVLYPEECETTRFLFIGRVMREKGIDELFTAMERLRAENIPCTLDILGGYEEDYKEKIAQAETAGWLTYHGIQKDVRPFIAASHCFVLPSWHEGMANTNLECAASARPLITSNIHGCKEAVITNVSGLLCEPKNAESLFGAMKRFCAMPNEARAAMGMAGRGHMEAVFDKKKVVQATMEKLGV